MVELELPEVFLRRSGVRLAVFALVLAVLGDSFKLLDLAWLYRGVANELVDVSYVPAQIAPSKHPLAAVSVLDSKVQCLVEQEGLLVALRSEDIGIDLVVLAVFFGEKLCLTLLVNTLHNKLVLEVLGGLANASGSVLEDELGVAFG